MSECSGKISALKCEGTINEHYTVIFYSIRPAASMAWIKQRTAEYRISNRRILKNGIAALYLFN